MTSAGASGQIVVSGQPFDQTLAFFVETLNMQLDLITPADSPSLAVVSSQGLSLRIDGEVAPGGTITIQIPTGAAETVIAPNGVVVNFVDPTPPLSPVPAMVPELVISKADGSWGTGRAGMRYRDLIPSRHGGRFIASHIEVCDGGPVPDLVHHHAIRFQMIFCHHGWVDVVYEDQGEPFRLEAGDVVLQPPHIRHKVLASSAGAQVLEIGCPADHDTLFDHTMTLPTGVTDPDRDFGGQRFVRHQRSEVPWEPAIHPGFETQHTAIDKATDGLASVRVLRSNGSASTTPQRHEGEFWFIFILEGTVSFSVDGSANAASLGEGDSVSIPANLTWTLRDASPDLVWVEIVVP